MVQREREKRERERKGDRDDDEKCYKIWLLTFWKRATGTFMM